MAISTQVNNNLYKRALSEADKQRLAQIAQTQGAAAASSAYLASQNATQGATTPPAPTPGTGGATVTPTSDAAAARERAQAAQQQMQASQERARVLSSGDTKAINEYLQKEAQQRAIEQAAKSGNTQAAAQMQQAMDAEERARILSSGNQQQINQYLIEQSRQQAGQNAYQKAVASATPATSGHGLSNAPTINGNYIWYGWMGNNDMTTMNDEDKANWQKAMDGWNKGDYTAYNEGFQTNGNWASYVDDKGNVNGMLRYIGDGIGGYVPVNNGQLLQNGFSGNLGDYAFYGPDGSVYTADSSGRLTKAGTWTADYDQVMKNGYYYNNPDRYFVGKDGKYYTYGDVPDDKLAEWGYVRKYDGIFYEPETIARNNALKNGDITPEQLALARAAASRNAGDIPGGSYSGGSYSGGGYSGGVSGGGSYTPTPAPSSGGNTPTGATTPSGGSVPSGSTGGTGYTPYQLTLDQFDYGTAPEWNGTEYEQKRDAALEAAQNMRWDGSEYQTERDRLLEEAMRPYEGSPYDQQRDDALARYGEEWQGSEYQQQRDDALRRAENMRWNYDPSTDPVYQAYQKQYRREGQRAAQEALAQASARTGGLANSYAVTAASQAGDYYAAQLSDRLPQVYQDAYNRYLNEYQKQMELSGQYAGYDDREYARWADQQGKNLDLADRYNQYGQQDYDQYRDRVSQQLSGADRYNGYDQTEYQRYMDEYGQQLDAADRYQSYGGQEYDRYRDRLGQWNTDRAFQYGINRDAVEDARYADETAYARNYRAQRDAIEDQRYDQQWAQQLREYADAQGWKAAEWQQYLREYGDQLSERERQWAYQMARDAVSDAQYADQQAWNRSTYADEREYEREQDALDNQYRSDVWNQSLREYDDEQELEAWNYLRTNGIVTGKYAQILGVPDGTTYEQYYSRYLGGGSSGGAFEDSEIANPDYTGSGGGSGSGNGYSGGGSGSGSGSGEEGGGDETTATPRYNIVGKHSNGKDKTSGYDLLAKELALQVRSGYSASRIRQTIYQWASQGRIADWEIPIIMNELGLDIQSSASSQNPNNEGKIRQYTK